MKPEAPVPLAGLPTAEAVIRRWPERIDILYFTPQLAPALKPHFAALSAKKRRWQQVEAAELARIAGSPQHGGVVAMTRLPEIGQFDAVGTAMKPDKPKLIVILDGVSNPHNLGAIARTAAFFGLDRLVITDHPMQAAPSPAAHRVAEGGLVQLKIERMTKPIFALKRLAENGYLTLATTLDAAKPITPADVPADKPIALILGNEEHGVAGPVIGACRHALFVPGGGAIQSLNVSVTAGILIHAFSAR